MRSAPTEMFEVTKEIKELWANITSKTIINITDINHLSDLFAKLWLKLDRRIKRLECGRDSWKNKYQVLKGKKVA